MADNLILFRYKKQLKQTVNFVSEQDVGHCTARVDLCLIHPTRDI